MSLKDLISTLIETVFTNKKSYIASRCLPSWSNTLQTFAEQQWSTVVPYDGWARIQSHCNGLQASVVQNCVVTVNNQNDTWPSILLPVKKVNICIGTYLKTSKAKLTFGLFAIKQTNNLATEVCHG